MRAVPLRCKAGSCRVHSNARERPVARCVAALVAEAEEPNRWSRAMRPWASGPSICSRSVASTLVGYLWIPHLSLTLALRCQPQLDGQALLVAGGSDPDAVVV